MFKTVDTDAKAYLLGFIASDGGLSHSGGITISIHNRDEEVLWKIKRALGIDVPIRRRTGSKVDMVVLRLSSRELTQDVARLLGVPTDSRSLKKDRLVQMPKLATPELQWAFIRGYFDGDGSICMPTRTRRSPQVSIASQSTHLKEDIARFCGIPCTLNEDVMWWYGNNALDFLHRLYGSRPQVYLQRKADLYAQWSTWTPSLLKGLEIGGDEDGLQWTKTRQDAVPPMKTRASDSGYDVTAIDVLKTEGDVTFYRTGLKVKPPFGYYCDLVSRSSIAKTGYMMANGVGIIDRTYVGEVIVALRKVNQNAPDLKLPYRVAQLVPRQIVHFELIEVEDFEQSARGTGGFGSTGTS